MMMFEFRGREESCPFLLRIQKYQFNDSSFRFDRSGEFLDARRIGSAMDNGLFRHFAAHNDE
jgi:hypothetical protein